MMISKRLNVFTLVLILSLLGYMLQARESPSRHEISEILSVLDLVLTQDNFSEPWLTNEVRSRLTGKQICSLALICHGLNSRDTSDPVGSMEDGNRIYCCLCTCIKLLKETKSVPELRCIYYRINISDGLMRDWIVILGKDWRTFLKIRDS